MQHDGPQTGRFYGISFEDPREKTPTTAPGQLIPAPKAYLPQAALPPRPERLMLTGRPVLALLLLALMMSSGLGSAWYLDRYAATQLASLSSQTGAPVIIQHPYTNEAMPLTYGVQLAFTEPNFFITTRDAFIDAKRTFVEADLAAMKLRYFTDGVLRKEYLILGKGAEGSFFETPAGLYQIEQKNPRHFTSAGQLYLPYSIGFQGNFYIHGTPVDERGVVATSTSHGGIQLSDADAEELYRLISPDTPVLVFTRRAEAEEFLYEPKVPELKTPQYVIADIETGTVLSGNNLDMSVPIASLTKLMTAVVAAEYINLDTRVVVSTTTIIQSLIPRLAERSSVSLYSLFELLLLESSNEAAEVIAAEVGREQFITYMNERATTLGLEHTRFTDPSGIDAGNVSSASDLLRLIQYIYQNRRFIIDISAGKKLPDIYVTGEFANVSNFNDIEGTDNFIGGKIGETTAAKQTSVSLHTLKVNNTERTVAIVVLGSEARSADVRALLNYAQERFGDTTTATSTN